MIWYDLRWIQWLCMFSNVRVIKKQEPQTIRSLGSIWVLPGSFKLARGKLLCTVQVKASGHSWPPRPRAVTLKRTAWNVNGRLLVRSAHLMAETEFVANILCVLLLQANHGVLFWPCSETSKERYTTCVRSFGWNTHVYEKIHDCLQYTSAHLPAFLGLFYQSNSK